MEKSKHGMVGQRNAMIDDEPRTANVHFRITRHAKEKYCKQALINRMNLSAWIIATLDRACDERRLDFKR